MSLFYFAKDIIPYQNAKCATRMTQMTRNAGNMQDAQLE